MENIIINAAISEEELQTIAQANFGRELAGIELNRIREGWLDSDKVHFARLDMVCRAIEDALDTKNNVWREIDTEYESSKGPSSAIKIQGN